MALIEPLIFPFDHDWSVEFMEDLEFLTTVQTFDDETEQRSALIVAPQRRFTQHCKAMSQQEYNLLLARLWGGLTKLWWAPYWPKAQYLTANLSIGAVAVAQNGVAMQARVDQGVLLYRSSSYAEVAIVTSVSNVSIGVEALTKAWNGITRRDIVVPVYQAKMLLNSSIGFPDVDLGEMDMTFQLEPGL